MYPDVMGNVLKIDRMSFRDDKKLNFGFGPEITVNKSIALPYSWPYTWQIRIYSSFISSIYFIFMCPKWRF